MDEMRTEPCGKRVRAFLEGVPVADSFRPLLVWERPYYPTYYFPEADVREDVLASSRHVLVVCEGTTLAESRNSRLLFETGLPARVYLPKTHVRMDLLKPSQTVTHCPYKGQAEHWSLERGGTTVPDVAWSYRAPFAESQKVAGMLAFYPGKVELLVDGERWS